MRCRAFAALGSVSVVAAAALGCGADPAAEARVPGAASEIRRVHHVWLERLAGGDADACDLLTQRARLAFVTSDTGACFMAVDRFAASITPEERRAFSKVRVRRVTVIGARATIADHDLITPPELHRLTRVNGQPMILRRVHGRWRIDWIG